MARHRKKIRMVDFFVRLLWNITGASFLITTTAPSRFTSIGPGRSFTINMEIGLEPFTRSGTQLHFSIVYVCLVILTHHHTRTGTNQYQHKKNGFCHG
jgi:hypothetical protein